MVAYSLKRVFVGFGLSSLTGIILGVAMGYSKTINAIVRPIFNIIRPIPGLAWIPLGILWFGIGETTKYFIIFMGGFSNIVLNSFDGTNKVDQTLVGAAELLGANKFQIFTHNYPAQRYTLYLRGSAGLFVDILDGGAGSGNDQLLRGRWLDHQHGYEYGRHSSDSGGNDFHRNRRLCAG